MPVNKEGILEGAYPAGDNQAAASGFFVSLIFMTSRPLYLPQVGQTWWGNIKAWHWGHSTSAGGFKARWLNLIWARDLLFFRFGSAPIFNSVL
jgi:hypothetical protein